MLHLICAAGTPPLAQTAIASAATEPLDGAAAAPVGGGDDDGDDDDDDGDGGDGGDDGGRDRTPKVRRLELSEAHTSSQRRPFRPSCALVLLSAPDGARRSFSRSVLSRSVLSRSLDHRRVTRPRSRRIEAEMQGVSTGYLRVFSDTIENYDRELREGKL